MTIKLSGLSKVFRRLMYKDKMDVYRFSVQPNNEYSYDNVENAIPIYKDIPCKISNNFKDLPEEDSFMINPTNQYVSVFCEPSYKIQKGDKLVLHRMDDLGNEVETFTEFAGKPNVEVTHLEITLVDRQYA